MCLLLVGCGQPDSLAPTPTWRGIVPGQTTQEEVVAILGPPAHSTSCPKNPSGVPRLRDLFACFMGPLRYEYHENPVPNLYSRIHEIYFKSGVVWYIVERTSAFPSEVQLQTLDFVQQHGNPERVTWSRRSPHTRVLLYCEQGVMVHATMRDVWQVVYFPPMTLDQCLNTFTNELARQNPFPDSSVIGPEDLWGYNTQFEIR